MRKLALGFLMCVGLASTAMAAAATAPGEWLVRTALDNPTVADMKDLLGVSVSSVSLVDGDLYLVKVDPSVRAASLRRSARKSGLVGRIQPNFVYRLQWNDQPVRTQDWSWIWRQTPSFVSRASSDPAIKPAPRPAEGRDPMIANQWGLTKVNASTAWNTETGDRKFIVAVLDTGVDYNHEDLAANMWRNPAEIAGNNVDDDNNGYVDDIVGWDFAENDNKPWDKMATPRFLGNPGHGTHCSGVIGAVNNNGVGISGVIPEVSIMALRFITETGQGDTAGAVRAIRYAVANGAKVVSNSWGGEGDPEADDSELKNVVREAEEAGVILVFAAGNGRSGVGYDNDNDPKPTVPSSYDNANIISVAASDINDKLGAFSNFGATTVDIAAPGVKILSTVPGSKYEDQIKVLGISIAPWDGTSMAAPHVAAVTALTWMHYPNESAAQIKARVLDTARKVPGLQGKILTGGVLDAAAALR